MIVGDKTFAQAGIDFPRRVIEDKKRFSNSLVHTRVVAGTRYQPVKVERIRSGTTVNVEDNRIFPFYCRRARLNLLGRNIIGAAEENQNRDEQHCNPT